MAQPQPHRVGRNGHGGGPATCSITGKWFGCAVLFSTLEPGAFRYRFGVTWRNLPPNPPPGEDQRSSPTRPGDSRPVWPGDFVLAVELGGPLATRPRNADTGGWQHAFRHHNTKLHRNVLFLRFLRRGVIYASFVSYRLTVCDSLGCRLVPLLLREQMFSQA